MLNTHHRGFTPSGTWFEDTGSARDRGSTQDTGQAVVLAHGVGLDLNMWDAQVASLARSCRVIRFDMLGHGRTPALPRTSTLADYCEQLHDLVDFLNLAPFVLVGFSMGGVITQRFSADHPERVRGIVLMSTVYRRTPAELEGVQKRLALTERDGPGGIVEHAVDRWFPDDFQAGKAAAVEQIRTTLAANDRRGYTDAYRVFVQADEAVGDALTQVACPAMVMTGGGDVGSTPQIAERMCADLKHGELHVLPGLRHMITMQDPQTVNQKLLHFIGRL